MAPAQMVRNYDLDDIEPLCASERCDQHYGAYHIGREDETRDEVALFFEAQLFPEPDFLTNRLWSIINRHGGRLSAFSEYAIAKSNQHLHEPLSANIQLARSLPLNPETTLEIAVVELAKPSVEFVDSTLRSYTAYVGCSNISWPSNFRSLITAGQEYV